MKPALLKALTENILRLSTCPKNNTRIKYLPAPANVRIPLFTSPVKCMRLTLCLKHN